MLKWKRKKGALRAQDCQNQYVIELDKNGDITEVRWLIPHENTQWQHTYDICFVTEAKEFIEKMNTRVNEYLEIQTQTLENRQDFYRHQNHHFLQAFNLWLQLTPEEHTRVAQTHPALVKMFEKLEPRVKNKKWNPVDLRWE